MDCPFYRREDVQEHTDNATFQGIPLSSSTTAEKRTEVAGEIDFLCVDSPVCCPRRLPYTHFHATSYRAVITRSLRENLLRL
jgi:hypothetical protein